MKTHLDLVKAIAEIAASMPLMRTLQLYGFARFLESHPLPAEEKLEPIAEAEAEWDAQFSAADESKLAALLASVEAEINEGKTSPMFDEHGKFIESRAYRNTKALKSIQRRRFKAPKNAPSTLDLLREDRAR